MKKRSPGLKLSNWAVAITCALMSTAQAAAMSVKFAVPNSQIQALGIQTVTLQTQTSSVKVNFPAQVVIPAAAEQVVSSPVVGLVTQLLVQQNQAVQPGTPLVRIVSPELGQLQLQLLQATTRAKLTRQTAQRELQLFDEGIIPRRRVEEAQAALMEGKAALNQAKAALRLSGMSAATIERVAASGKPQESITLAATQPRSVDRL